MQARPGHNVGGPAKDASCQIFDVHQLVKTQLTSPVVKEQVDIRVGSRLIARGRAKQV
jgi:hypothetical protein